MSSSASSNMHEGSSGLSNHHHHHHQHAPPYFENVENNAFAGFDPALDDGSSGATGAFEPQQWPYQQPAQLGLAQPQNHHNHSTALYAQDWHDDPSLSHPPLYTQDQDHFNSDFFANAYSPAAGPSAALHQSHFPHKQAYAIPVTTSSNEFDHASSRSAAPQEAQYNHHDMQFSHNQDPTYPSTVHAGTIAPRELQQKQELQQSGPQTAASNQPDLSNLQGGQNTEQPTQAPLPSSKTSGNFLVMSAEDIEGLAKSKLLDNFVHVGIIPQDVVVTKSTLPAYIPRKSRNEISRLLASNSNLKAQLKKKHGKKGSFGITKPIPVRPAIQAPKSAVSDVKPTTHADQSDDESDDDGDSSSASSDEESIQPPLPAVRPSKPSDAVKYDTIKALWRVPYRSALGDDIRKGLADFWEVAKTIRDRWKSDAAAVKQAEEAKKVYEIPLLKERVQSQRDLLETALRAAITDGHNDIIEHLGENLPLMNALAVSLQDRARDADYNGGLSKAVLELLSRCKTLTEGGLEKTGITKILPRFVKRGDDNVKSFAKKITDNAVAASKKRKEANKASAAASSQAKSMKSETTTAPQPGSPMAGNKRPRESDARNGQPVKKVASGAGSGLSNSSESPTSVAKKAQPSTEVKSGTSASAATAKKVVTKPTNFFSSLQPAYKKPGSAVQSNIASTAKTIASSSEKKPSQAPSSTGTTGTTTQSKPAFSFAATMANLTKTKEVETAPKKEDNTVSETPEEKSKRLRKEQRRSLRVSFKPESELVDIRYFEHDPEEDEGHYASQVRDVGDLESEGRMFKLQHQGNADRMDLDDDEEDDDAGHEADGFESKDYSPPSLIDFSDVPENDRSGNYVPYGGGPLEPESSEAEAQTQREANTLLAVYPQRSDIPASPKEPIEPFQEPTSPKDFGAPPELVTTRLRGGQDATTAGTSNSLPMSTSELSALIGSLTHQSNPAPPSQQAFQQIPDLQKIVAQISMPNQQQPQPMTQNTQYYQNSANFYNATAQHQQPNPYQQQPQTQQNVDVSALLASLQGHVPAAQPNVSDILGSLTSYAQQPQQQPQQQQAQAQAQYPYENEERRRLREAEAAQQQKGLQNNNKKKQGFDAKGNPKMFLFPCRFFQEGRCTKGANCTYRHDME